MINVGYVNVIDVLTDNYPQLSSDINMHACCYSVTFDN